MEVRPGWLEIHLSDARPPIFESAKTETAENFRCVHENSPTICQRPEESKDSYFRDRAAATQFVTPRRNKKHPVHFSGT